MTRHLVKLPPNKVRVKETKVAEYLMKGLFRMLMRYFSNSFLKANVIDTHLNCLDLSRQFK